MENEMALETLSPEQRARVEEIKDGIDLMDSQQLIQYGVGAQKNISGFSDFKESAKI